MQRRPAGRRPNIVLILADDMGYSDLGCYGGEINTPHLDGLARDGLRLTQMYNEARCCPTRASLLTGLYPHQTGVGLMVDDRGLPAYQGFLNDRCVTIAEALKPAGYRTYMTGKWHVGGRHGWVWDAPRAGEPGFPRPIDRGFDHHYGTLGGTASYFDPHLLIHDGAFLGHQGGDFYYTDAIGDHAVAMLTEAVTAGDPFFLHVAFTAPHYPLHALEEDIARYRGRYRAGWDVLRSGRHERQRSMGLLPHTWALSARDSSAPAWEQVPQQYRDWEDARMAAYAAQIDRMDQNVGKIAAALRARDVAEDTLLLFLSDNGASAEYLPPTVGPQIPPRTPDGRPVRKGNVPGVIPGGPDTFASYDLPWANLSDAPFRLYKHYVHEGGIATPLIAHWPGVVPAGGLAHQPCHLVDTRPPAWTPPAWRIQPSTRATPSCRWRARVCCRCCAARRAGHASARSSGSTKETALCAAGAGSWSLGFPATGSCTTWTRTGPSCGTWPRWTPGRWRS